MEPTNDTDIFEMAELCQHQQDQGCEILCQACNHSCSNHQKNRPACSRCDCEAWSEPV